MAQDLWLEFCGLIVHTVHTSPVGNRLTCCGKSRRRLIITYSFAKDATEVSITSSRPLMSLALSLGCTVLAGHLATQEGTALYCLSVLCSRYSRKKWMEAAVCLLACLLIGTGWTGPSPPLPPVYLLTVCTSSSRLSILDSRFSILNPQFNP